MTALSATRCGLIWKQTGTKDTVFDSEAVGEISDKAMEKSLKLNGVEDGKQSYGRMVDLMLNYFKDKGEL